MIHHIYPNELEIKDITDTVKSSAYLVLHLEIEGNGKLLTILYEKRVHFSFRVVNFPFICGNIPSAPAYGLFISQPIRYARACQNYVNFLYRARILTSRLFEQGYVATRLKSSLQKFYDKTLNVRVLR